MDFAKLSLPPGATIGDALAAIDAGGRQIALVLEGRRLVGVITDGDIRRGLLRGLSVGDPIETVLNRDPVTVAPSDPQSVVERVRAERSIRNIPVVDEDGDVLDLVVDGERIRTGLSTPVVLMAGGRGLRLGALTRDIPKPMVPVGERPMIEVIIARLRAQGFRRFIVSVNYLGEVIEAHLGDGAALDVSIEYLHESAPLGTAGALAQLKGRAAEPFVVMNADLLTDVDVREFVARHRAGDATATVGVREYIVDIPFGVVRLQDGVVRELTEKPRHRELVSAGMYVLEPEALGPLELESYRDMPDLLQLLIERGDRVGAYEIDVDWIDVGRPEDLERARARMERRR